MTYCCKMREKFVVGIVAQREDLPMPIEAVDFVDFEKRAPDGRTILWLRFCPFCGRRDPVGPRRVV